MALQTILLDVRSDALGNQATTTYDYDDVTLLISAIHIVNPTIQSYFVQANRIDQTKTYSTTVPAGQSQNTTIGNGQANRLQLTVTTSGKLDGVEWQARLV